MVIEKYFDYSTGEDREMANVQGSIMYICGYVLASMTHGSTENEAMSDLKKRGMSTQVLKLAHEILAQETAEESGSAGQQQ